ncbi:YqzG/YhdC family protein [Cohnella panacarvi]|uniref:YqzG/YhdC family protein n=1 Tax=Cohnella panacarvi TaxID=400776 RepID=UPI00047EE0A1|nr:YqzG/YhdC family protein [Cohnella panacarvi]
MRDVILALGLSLGAVESIDIHPLPASAQPEYAEWGRIAMQRTAERYRLPIVDYQHIGRRQLSSGIAEEKFKLWLRGDNREFGVFVTIRFETATEKILAVEFEETSR